MKLFQKYRVFAKYCSLDSILSRCEGSLYRLRVENWRIIYNRDDDHPIDRKD